jgi:AraC-like DNA-binding protein
VKPVAALQTVLQIDLGDISIREVEARGSMHVDEHEHRSASLTIIRNGMITDRAGDAVEMLRSGDVLFLPAGTMHENTVAEPGSHGVVIELAEGFASLFLPDRRGSIRLSNLELRGTPLELIAQLSTADAVAPLLIRALITEILARTVRAAAGEPPPAWLLRVIEEIDAHYAGGVSLAQAASSAGVSPVRTRHALRRWYGRTFAEMLRERRISAALALLESGVSLGRIAIECGFYDQSHFTRAFEAVRGISPHKYRSCLR